MYAFLLLKKKNYVVQVSYEYPVRFLGVIMQTHSTFLTGAQGKKEPFCKWNKPVFVWWIPNTTRPLKIQEEKKEERE